MCPHPNISLFVDVSALIINKILGGGIEIDKKSKVKSVRAGRSADGGAGRRGDDGVMAWYNVVSGLNKVNPDIYVNDCVHITRSSLRNAMSLVRHRAHAMSDDPDRCTVTR